MCGGRLSPFSYGRREWATIGCWSQHDSIYCFVLFCYSHIFALSGCYRLAWSSWPPLPACCMSFASGTRPVATHSLAHVASIRTARGTAGQTPSYRYEIKPQGSALGMSSHASLNERLFLTFVLKLDWKKNVPCFVRCALMCTTRAHGLHFAT